MIGTPMRCVQGAPITVAYQSVNADGEPTDTDPGTVTVDVTNSLGTAVATAGVTAGTAGSRTYTIAATLTAELDELHIAWKTGTATIGRDVVHVVGRPYVSLDEIRNADASLSATDPPALIRARGEVEDMFERAMGHTLSFVPRFSTASIAHPGTPSLRLPHYFVRSVRWVKYGSSNGTLVDFTAYDLATTVLPEPSGMVSVTGGSWPYGRLLVGYEHGMDAPDAEVKRAAIAAVRRQVGMDSRAVSSRALSYTSPQGEVQRFPTPGLGPWVTGIPEIDELLQSYRRQYPALVIG